MPYLLGTDEAGYGPNLGPLTIAASLWEIDDAACDAYTALAEFVTAQPRRGDERLAIADSKRLYQSGGSLAPLETGVFAVLASLHRSAGDISSLYNALDCERTEVPWSTDQARVLPQDSNIVLIERYAAKFRDSKCRPVALRAKVIQPEEFNRLCDRYGSKGQVLSRLTLDLVKSTLAAAPEGAVRVVCDKHGGRNAYAPLLRETFDLEPSLFRSSDETKLETVLESRSESVYRMTIATRETELRFQAKGESFLPAALASMTAKYLRELAMHEWNAWWQSRLPEISPTAGYPQDALRFRTQIAAEIASLKWSNDLWWRRR